MMKRHTRLHRRGKISQSHRMHGRTRVCINNRVDNDIKSFEIHALLSCQRGNSAENRARKFKKYTCYFEFSRSGFPCSQDKRLF